MKLPNSQNLLRNIYAISSLLGFLTLLTLLIDDGLILKVNYTRLRDLLAAGKYTRLRDLLAAGKWKEADQETTRAMLQAAKWDGKRWSFSISYDIPCEDLRVIDQLWLSASEGKFGFSVQKEIYKSIRGTSGSEEPWDQFGDRVGWRKGRLWSRAVDLTFNNAEAPKAHLPSFHLTSWIEARGGSEDCVNTVRTICVADWEDLFYRADDCNL